MAAQKQLRHTSLPSDSAIVRSKKVALKRDLLIWLEKKEVGWSHDRVSTFGFKFVQILTDTLWYIDGPHQTLQNRACQIPNEFKEFQGYNKPEQKTPS